ncbi:MAG: VWA domain-containing protein, partial [Bryobacteraceae bacterium]|nr:VWA domain-containing protein [Bryobacteraceae bacterium]
MMYLRKPRLVPAVFAAAVLLPLVLEAQQQAQTTQQENEEPTIKVDVDVVNILFSVRDRKGALVPGLS